VAPRRYIAAALVLGTLAPACAHPKPPTVTGGELYAQLQTLRDTGTATVGRVVIRKTQVLTTGRDGQSFLVEQVIEHCRGGDPQSDVDCTLALLLDQRFRVVDHMPRGRAPKPEKADPSRSILTAGVLVGLTVAATGGLVYGVATCEFAGCKAVFGVPLVFIGGAVLFSLGRD
jgi:hypothetical protein